MKKHILLTLLMVLATSFCYSQVKVTLQGGAGLNDITQTELYNGEFGYRFGVGLEFPLARTWSLQTGVQFLNRLVTMDEYVKERRVHEGHSFLLHKIAECKMNSIYLQLPIKVAKYLPLNANCGIQISTGVYVAYGVGGNTKGKTRQEASWDHGYIIPEEVSNLFKSTYTMRETFAKYYGLKRLDFGLSLGADFKYKSCFIGAGLEYGLVPIEKEFPKNMLDTSLTATPHNIGIEMHIGYCFSLGK